MRILMIWVSIFLSFFPFVRVKEGYTQIREATTGTIETYYLSQECYLRFYNSGWLDIQPKEYLRINHNLGGDPEKYFVYMDFFMTTTGSTPYDSVGIHQMFYGSMFAPSGAHGAKWSSLTSRQIIVYREPSDKRVHKVRVGIIALGRLGIQE